MRRRDKYRITYELILLLALIAGCGDPRLRGMRTDCIELQSREEDLFCTMEGPPEPVRAGAAVPLRFALRNLSMRDYHIVRASTPLSGRSGGGFLVWRGDEPIPARADGSRGAPESIDIDRIAPGDIASATVDLREGYALDVPGTYEVAFVGHLRAAVPRSGGASRLETAPTYRLVPCNHVNIVILPMRPMDPIH